MNLQQKTKKSFLKKFPNAVIPVHEMYSTQTGSVTLKKHKALKTATPHNYNE